MIQSAAKRNEYRIQRIVSGIANHHCQSLPLAAYHNKFSSQIYCPGPVPVLVTMCQPTNSYKGIVPQKLEQIPFHKIDVEDLIDELDTPYKIARTRMLAVGIPPQNPKLDLDLDVDVDVDFDPIFGGLASPLVNLLAQAVDEWLDVIRGIQNGTACTTSAIQKTSREEKKEDESISGSLSEKSRSRSPLDILAHCKEIRKLRQILTLHLQISKCDVTLAEEMAKGCGSHRHLSRIIKVDIYSVLNSSTPTQYTDMNVNIYNIDTKSTEKLEYEQAEDSLVEIQDLACELAHCNRSSYTYPAKLSPYTAEELHSRLPLTFDICSPKGIRESFMVRQVTERQSAQDDVGFVMWPSAVALSSWLLDNVELLVANKPKKILEIGSGCGLTGLVAGRIVQKYGRSKHLTTPGIEIVDEASNMNMPPSVILSDFNRKVLTNIDQNIQLNGLEAISKPFHLDFYLQPGDNHEGGWRGCELSQLIVRQEGVDNDHDHDHQAGVDLIIAADTICKASDAVAVSKTIYDALVPGGEAIVVSANAKHRFGVEIFEDECKKLGLRVTVANVGDMCNGKLLPMDKDAKDPCGIRQTSGFVDGMTLTMFRAVKPKPRT